MVAHGGSIVKLFRERLSVKLCTRQSRKVIWDIIDTLFLTCSGRSYFCFFSLVLGNLPFFQISLKNSELKTTHKTFRDCDVHFFQQPFSKLRYTILQFSIFVMHFRFFACLLKLRPDLPCSRSMSSVRCS